MSTYSDWLQQDLKNTNDKVPIKKYSAIYAISITALDNEWQLTDDGQ